MFLQRKALYNLIQLKVVQLEEKEIQETQLEPWQIQNHRLFSTEELFRMLHEVSIPFDMGDFEAYAKNYDTPEEMAEVLTKEMESIDADRTYLIIFEIWRRLFPERQSLTLFCDELDFQIVRYEKEEDYSPEELQDTVAYLQNILDKNVDAGATPEQAFHLIQTCCANDLEGFLYTYIFELVEEDNDSYASELLDGFYRYVANKSWFDYLKIRVEIIKDPEEGYDHLEKLILWIQEHPDIELCFEILAFLAKGGNHTLFSLLTNTMVNFLKCEEDFQDFSRMCLNHYDYLELKEPAQGIQYLLDERSSKTKEMLLSPADPDLLELKRILKREYRIKSS